MFENLSERLERSFKLLRGESRITELNVAETLKDVRNALLEADVSYNVVKTFIDVVKNKALGSNVLTAVKPGEMMVKIVYDELVALMGGESMPVNIKGDPAVVLIAGLQGSGKTTFSGKLANYLKGTKGVSPLLVACDVYRPAAIEQLKILGSQIDVPVYTEEGSNKPVEIAVNALKHAKLHGYGLVIVDTAGRLAIDEEMMNEISAIKKAVNPQETLFVVDSMTGQDAVNTAREFNERLNFDGVVLTKLDGDTRGGAALSIRSVVKKPVKFMSSGEKLDSLDIFHPDRMASRILGQGDIQTIVERIQKLIDEEDAKKMQKRLAKDQFDFDDFYKQIQQIKKMGSLKDVMSMIPGINKMVKNIDIGDDAFKYVEAMIQSMTPAERCQPQIINASRRKRIAMGSGRDIADVNRLMKQFDGMKKMMRNVARNDNAVNKKIKRR
ncbi:MAG: signal recognition particle protein [Prevotellaceae bacterium]|jgi:signal recognition particle subunit SRP54|nr:signal recognition particle protein [Prevotellaceae bacterium]